MSEAAEESAGGPYILGLDLGTNSIGWALVGLDREQKPNRILKTGVRIFEAGKDGLGTSKEEPKNQKRRLARSARRALWRRRMRADKLFRALQRADLLPAGDGSTPEGRYRLLQELDNHILATRRAEATATGVLIDHVLPYWLRALALDQRLAPHEFGRALYHLVQRRGYKSNRIAERKSEDDEDRGAVSQGISQLETEMEAAGARTLGEYFASLDPESQRIRCRWTARSMYEAEFEAIWTAQSQHHPESLDKAQKKKIQGALFDQRPLKVQSHLIGECLLEPGRKRAPWALLASQRFRYMQRVNDLKIEDFLGAQSAPTAEQRAALIARLEEGGDLKFSELKKLWGLKRNDRFNLQRGGEKRLTGNRTRAKLVEIFGAEKWSSLSPVDQDQVVEDVLTIESTAGMIRRGRQHWHLDSAAASRLAHVQLEEGYCSLSRKALARVIPELEQGEQYATVRKKLYHQDPSYRRQCDRLPLVDPKSSHDKALRTSRISPTSEVRNPVVTRVLTELRLVVNHLVRHYGRPERIRVELARDLKIPAKRREELAKRMRQQQGEREKAKAKILAEAFGPDGQVRRSDIEKALLWEECGHVCPFTGKTIAFHSLFGPRPEFDIEHILPHSRSLDDSFLNKTLCSSEENRTRKGNRTPYEAYHGTPRWEEILQRVRSFQGPLAERKLERFRMTPEEVIDAFEAFSNRQLVDTQYASRLAAEYLGLLYGCRTDQAGVDANGDRRIQAGRGQVTGILRGEWELNRILGRDQVGALKSRDDHRHHAVDALCVALTDAGTVKMLSHAAERAVETRRRRFAPIPPPWPGFLEEARRSIQEIVVSPRVGRRVRGALHEETLYSKPMVARDAKGAEGIAHYTRKRVDRLSPKEVDKIVDGAVRARVQAALDATGKAKPADAFKGAADDPSLYPQITTKSDRTIPIKKVRVAVTGSCTPIGKGPRKRFVKPGNNHHAVIFEDAKGKWRGEVVSLLEATSRKAAGEPVVRRPAGFRFSLVQGDVLEVDDGSGGRKLMKVTSVWMTPSGLRLEYRPILDARLWAEARKAGAVPSPMIDSLRKLNACKVSIGPLGEVQRAND